MYISFKFQQIFDDGYAKCISLIQDVSGQELGPKTPDIMFSVVVVPF